MSNAIRASEIFSQYANRPSMDRVLENEAYTKYAIQNTPDYGSHVTPRGQNYLADSGIANGASNPKAGGGNKDKPTVGGAPVAALGPTHPDYKPKENKTIQNAADQVANKKRSPEWFEEITGLNYDKYLSGETGDKPSIPKLTAPASFSTAASVSGNNPYSYQQIVDAAVKNGWSLEGLAYDELSKNGETPLWKYITSRITGNDLTPSALGTSDKESSLSGDYYYQGRTGNDALARQDAQERAKLESEFLNLYGYRAQPYMPTEQINEFVQEARADQTNAINDQYRHRQDDLLRHYTEGTTPSGEQSPPIEYSDEYVRPNNYGYYYDGRSGNDAAWRKELEEAYEANTQKDAYGRSLGWQDRADRFEGNPYGRGGNYNGRPEVEQPVANENTYMPSDFGYYGVATGGESRIPSIPRQGEENQAGRPGGTYNGRPEIPSQKEVDSAYNEYLNQVSGAAGKAGQIQTGLDTASMNQPKAPRMMPEGYATPANESLAGNSYSEALQRAQEANLPDTNIFRQDVAPEPEPEAVEATTTPTTRSGRKYSNTSKKAQNSEATQEANPEFVRRMNDGLNHGVPLEQLMLQELQRNGESDYYKFLASQKR